MRLAAGVQRCDGRDVIRGLFVRVTRPCLLHGAVLEPGEHLLTCDEAAMLLDGGRAELSDPRDEPAVEEARRRAVERTMREVRAGAPAEGPWRAAGRLG